ncbi:synaptotagmin-15-like [Ptychodera flava]|uniref:synaptotagmin-15-like n=1 Tax=Ptychodera flava TaxID=63121 RepID=UPI003969CE45
MSPVAAPTLNSTELTTVAALDTTTSLTHDFSPRHGNSSTTATQMFTKVPPIALIASVSSAVLLVCLLVMCALWRMKIVRRMKLFNFRESEEKRRLRSAFGYNTPIDDCARRDRSMSQTGLTQYLTTGEVPRSLTSESIESAASADDGAVQPKHHSIGRRHSMTAFQFHHSLIGEIEPSLYKCSDDDDHDDILPPSPHGRIWFSMIYDAAVEQLTVKVVKAKHLPGRGKNNLPRDPFVKLYLLPDERASQQSKVRRKTNLPKWNETFIFQVGPKDVRKRTLRMTVYDIDRRRVRHAMGHVLVNLADVPLDKEEIMWRDLDNETQASAALGEINFSLTYQPHMDKLRVVILSLRNLRKLDYEESGIYVKVQLMHGRKGVKSKKTATQKGTCEPAYNESFSFTLTSKQMERTSILITIMTTGSTRLGPGVEYARVLTGPFMFARGEALVHWQEMMTQPKTTVTKWHSLKSPNNFM